MKLMLITRTETFMCKNDGRSKDACLQPIWDAFGPRKDGRMKKTVTFDGVKFFYRGARDVSSRKGDGEPRHIYAERGAA